MEPLERRRVLVTGATGFIGRHFLLACAREFDITAVVRRELPALPPGVQQVTVDLAHPLNRAALPERVDAVLHLVQGTKYRNYPDDAEEVVAVNVCSTLALANWARRTGCPHFVFASTAAFNPPGVDRVEEDAPLAPQSFYLRTKALAETLLADFTRYLAVTIVRPYAIYGPGQRGRLIPSIIAKVACGEPVVLEGDEEGMRLSPLYVADTMEALRRVLRGRVGGSMNLAGSESVTLRRIADVAGELLGRRPRFAVRPDLPVRWLTGVNRRMTALLEGHAPTTFAAGMAKTCADVVGA